jgi:hypothetical protein
MHEGTAAFSSLPTSRNLPSFIHMRSHHVHFFRDMAKGNTKKKRQEEKRKLNQKASQQAQQ